MSDLLAALASGFAIAGVVMALVKVSKRSDAQRMLTQLGTTVKANRPKSSHRSLLSGAAEKVRTTSLGARLASYAEVAHPSTPFSDVVALVLASIVGGALAGYLLFGGGPLVVISAVAGPIVVDRAMIRIGGRRTQKLEQQLPEALALQAASLRAGHSMIRSLRVVARESKAPMSDELGVAVKEIDLGRSLDEAIQRLQRRVQSRDVALWVTAMQVHRVTGGDLSKILESLASQIRSRAQMKSEVRAMTAQARFSGLVVALAPVGFFLLLSITARDQMRILYTTKLGLLFLFAGLSMQAAGLIWIRWLLRTRL